jgi:hypothetical protein
VGEKTYQESTTIQVCTATKRIYVHESIYTEFVAAMARHAETLKVGNSEEDDLVKLGPVQNEMQYLKVREYFEDCANKGFKFATGGRIEECAGYFVNPTIVDNPPADSRIVQEEPFGTLNIPTSLTIYTSGLGARFLPSTSYLLTKRKQKDLLYPSYLGRMKML